VHRRDVKHGSVDSGMLINRTTPCVGVCSTTYGDLVCRGCKRFSHEIVGWNGYEPDQKDRVWARLSELSNESVRACVRVQDEDRWQQTIASMTHADSNEFGTLVLRVLRNVVQKPIEAGLEPLGLPRDVLSRDVLRSIDREFYIRSMAYYERSFKTLAL